MEREREREREREEMERQAEKESDEEHDRRVREWLAGLEGHEDVKEQVADEGSGSAAGLPNIKREMRSSEDEREEKHHLHEDCPRLTRCGLELRLVEFYPRAGLDGVVVGADACLEMALRTVLSSHHPTWRLSAGCEMWHCSFLHSRKARRWLVVLSFLQ
jgi:hypothetical protein